MGEELNLTLSFPEAARERTLARQTGLTGAIQRFEDWMAAPDSLIRALRRQPSRAGFYAPMPQALATPLVEALAKRGVEQLYSHQAEAFAYAADGRNVVVVTPTASGKTLCYNLPVLN